MDARYEVRQLQCSIAELRKKICDEKRSEELDELIECLNSAESELDSVVGDLEQDDDDEDEDFVIEDQ